MKGHKRKMTDLENGLEKNPKTFGKGLEQWGKLQCLLRGGEFAALLPLNN